MLNRVNGVILFGDSVLAGTGASDRQLGCAKLVKQVLPVPVSIRSRNRDTSKIGLERIDTDVLQQREYSHVVILFGNNDCWLDESGNPQTSTDEFIENLRQMAVRIRGNSQVPLFCNLQPIDNASFFKTFPEYMKFCYSTKLKLDPFLWQKKYSDDIELLCNYERIGLIDIRSKLTQQITSTISTDGIHPTDSGHRMMSERILKALYKLDLTLTMQKGLHKSSVSL